MTTIEALAEFLGIDPAATSKAMPVTKDDGTVVLALVRGDDRLEEAKLLAAVGADVAPVDRGRDPRRVRRRSGLARPGRLQGRGDRRRGAPRGPVRRRREPRRLAPARRRARPRLPAALRRHPPAARGRHLPRLRRRAALPDRDRGRPHLQARHAVLGAARRDLPRRGRPGEAARHGQLRDRPGAHHRSSGRAEPRRARDPLAARDRPLRRPRRRAARRRGAGGRGGASSALGRWLGRPPRRPRPARPGRSSPTPT